MVVPLLPKFFRSKKLMRVERTKSRQDTLLSFIFFMIQNLNLGQFRHFDANLNFKNYSCAQKLSNCAYFYNAYEEHERFLYKIFKNKRACALIVSGDFVTIKSPVILIDFQIMMYL